MRIPIAGTPETPQHASNSFGGCGANHTKIMNKQITIMKSLAILILSAIACTAHAGNVQGWIHDNWNGQQVGVGLFPIEITAGGKTYYTETSADAGEFDLQVPHGAIITRIRHTGEPCLMDYSGFALRVHSDDAKGIRLYIQPAQ